MYDVGESPDASCESRGSAGLDCLRQAELLLLAALAPLSPRRTRNDVISFAKASIRVSPPMPLACRGEGFFETRGMHNKQGLLTERVEAKTQGSKKDPR